MVVNSSFFVVCRWRADDHIVYSSATAGDCLFLYTTSTSRQTRCCGSSSASAKLSVEGKLHRSWLFWNKKWLLMGAYACRQWRNQTSYKRGYLEGHKYRWNTFIKAIGRDCVVTNYRSTTTDSGIFWNKKGLLMGKDFNPTMIVLESTGPTHQGMWGQRMMNFNSLSTKTHMEILFSSRVTYEWVLVLTRTRTRRSATHHIAAAASIRKGPQRRMFSLQQLVVV